MLLPCRGSDKPGMYRVRRSTHWQPEAELRLVLCQKETFETSHLMVKGELRSDHEARFVNVSNGSSSRLCRYSTSKSCFSTRS